MDAPCCGPGYASPAEAVNAPREKLLYSIAIYTGTGIQKPDYLATVDADPESPTYSQVIHRLEMPGIGDELHHMGWNACSSCNDDASMSRKYLLVPGVRSNNIHVVDNDLLGRSSDAHQARRTLTINRLRSDGHWRSAAKGNLASDIASLGALGEDCAPHHIVDFATFDACTLNSGLVRE